MKQFLDVFQNIQQMDAGAWIAAGAVVTGFGLALYAVATFFSRIWYACTSSNEMGDSDAS
jgi:hypothetical protein